MRKQLANDNKGLKIYFTKKECELYELNKDDILDLSDMIIRRNKKHENK